MVQRGDPTQGDSERSLEIDDAVRGGMNRLPTLRARGAAAFEQAFARRMLRLRKTVELTATSCSNAPAGPNCLANWFMWARFFRSRPLWIRAEVLRNQLGDPGAQVDEANADAEIPPILLSLQVCAVIEQQHIIEQG